jgi:hypothetical protein
VFSRYGIQPEEALFVLLLGNIAQPKRQEERLDTDRWRLDTVAAQRTAEFAQANEKLSREIGGTPEERGRLVFLGSRLRV